MKTKEEILDNLIGGVRAEDKHEVWYSDAITAMDLYFRENAAELLKWYEKLSPAEKCTVHPPAGSGGCHGLYNMTPEDLVAKWLWLKSTTR